MKKIKSVKGFIISPLFIILCLVIAFWGSVKNVAIYIIVVLLHEFGHFIIARSRGYKIKKFYLMPYGVCMSFDENLINENDELLIAIAGPAINLFFVLLCITLWWCFPEVYYYTDYFCFCNMILALFNLIPCFPLDGGRILVSILSKKYDRQRVQTASMTLNYIVSLLLVCLFFFSFFSGVNFTYLFIAIFLFSSSINPKGLASYDYIKLNINRKKLLKGGTNIKFLAVDADLPIYKIIARCSKTKFNIIYVIFERGQVKVMSEYNLFNLAQKYPCTMSIREIMKTNELHNAIYGGMKI